MNSNSDCDLVNAPSVFRLARNISKLSTHKKHRLGAVVVDKGHPISVGCNQSKTHPNAPYTGLHAEIQAIKTSGRKSLDGCSIFVYRRRRDGKIGMARPCPHCMKEIKEMGIRWVYYSVPEYPYWEVEKV